MKCKKLVIGVLCAVGILGATEIHVSKSGDNKNQGSADAPVATIAKAVGMAKPGDIVKIGPGIYREQVFFKCSGTEDAPIVFEGTRGENGEYLTIVEGNGVALSEWEPAPEIAPDVWKTKLERCPAMVLMDGDRITLINRRTMELKPWEQLPAEMNENMFWGAFGPNCKRMPGFDLLKLPADIWVSHSYFRGRKEQFWPAIAHVMTGWLDGYLYLRFANGEKPEAHSFTASYGECFLLTDVSNLTLRDLHMRGSRIQIHIRGKSSNNIIEKCLLMHGRARIVVEEDVSNTTIRDNVLTSGFITSGLFGHRGASDMRGGLLYVIFKYIIGEASSDDSGMRILGAKNTKIHDNIVIQGLIGMDNYGVGVEVARNVFRKMSSVGITTGDTMVGEVHHNLLMDCGISLRVHRIRHKRAKREEYHYCNLFVQPRLEGSHTFVHSESFRDGDDMINFEPDTSPNAKKGAMVYKQNPPNPVDAGKIYIYHNTFWGGREWDSPVIDLSTYSKRFREPMPFFELNNIYKDGYRISTKTHLLTGPNLLYVFGRDIPADKRRDPEVPKINKVLDFKASQTIWNKNDLPGMPDMTLAPNSPALEAGVDISKPFTIRGKEYPALRGFNPGYFKGKAPAMGALQEGESQKMFNDMFLRSEAVVKMLGEIREKTAAEARSKATGK